MVDMNSPRTEKEKLVLPEDLAPAMLTTNDLPSSVSTVALQSGQY